MKDNELLKIAQTTMKNAYVPYSKFKVGAALLCDNGNIYNGCNFECVAFGAGVCAERVALGKAIANNERKFVALAVCGGEKPTFPCGICRQALIEFGDFDIICASSDLNKIKKYRLSELLPNYFFEKL